MSAKGRNIKDDLLVKFITGQCSVGEISEVEQWLAGSPENQNHFDELEATWVLSSKSYPDLHFDSKSAWNKVSEKIDEIEKPVQSLNPESPKRIGSRKSIYYFTAIAAALLIGVFISQTLFLDPIPKETIVASLDGKLSKILLDGSSISLNDGSEISYSDDFNENSRTVKLKGEAFFDIKPDKNKPFIIKSEFGNIRVLGTSFNVIARENSNFEVQVETGLVQLFTTSNENKDTSSIFLEAGNSGIINYQTGALLKVNKKDPASLFWLNKQLNFNKTPLSEVFNCLEKNYPINIDFDAKMLANCKLTVKFQDEDINTILQIISTTFNFEIETNKPNQIKVLANDPDCPSENI